MHEQAPELPGCPRELEVGPDFFDSLDAFVPQVRESQRDFFRRSVSATKMGAFELLETTFDTFNSNSIPDVPNPGPAHPEHAPSEEPASFGEAMARILERIETPEEQARHHIMNSLGSVLLNLNLLGVQLRFPEPPNVPVKGAGVGDSERRKEGEGNPASKEGELFKMQATKRAALAYAFRKLTAYLEARENGLLSPEEALRSIGVPAVITPRFFDEHIAQKWKLVDPVVQESIFKTHLPRPL